jgi:hypothetical protein
MENHVQLSARSDTMLAHSSNLLSHGESLAAVPVTIHSFGSQRLSRSQMTWLLDNDKPEQLAKTDAQLGNLGTDRRDRSSTRTRGRTMICDAEERFFTRSVRHGERLRLPRSLRPRCRVRAHAWAEWTQTRQNDAGKACPPHEVGISARD